MVECVNMCVKMCVNMHVNMCIWYMAAVWWRYDGDVATILQRCDCMWLGMTGKWQRCGYDVAEIWLRYGKACLRNRGPEFLLVTHQSFWLLICPTKRSCYIVETATNRGIIFSLRCTIFNIYRTMCPIFIGQSDYITC